MVAGFADRDGVLLPIGPPLAAMIAACSFKAILSLPGRRQISYLFRVPDVLPPPWPRLASFPDWALRGALEAIVAGKRLPGFR